MINKTGLRRSVGQHRKDGKIRKFGKDVSDIVGNCSAESAGMQDGMWTHEDL